MARLIAGSRFIGKAEVAGAEIFFFRKGTEELAVCWTKKGAVEHHFSRAPKLALGRDGEMKAITSEKIRIEEAPQYVFFS
jgi:hypothetical protein